MKKNNVHGCKHNRIQWMHSGQETNREWGRYAPSRAGTWGKFLDQAQRSTKDQENL